MRPNSSRSIAIVFVLASIACVAAVVVAERSAASRSAAQPQAMSRARQVSDQPPVAVAAALSRDGASVSGSRRILPNLYLAPKGDSLCYYRVFATHVSIGCNPASDFFAGQAAVAGLSQDHAPPNETLTVSGVARPDIASVVLLAGGTPMTSAVNSDGGFSFQWTAASVSDVPAKVTLIAQDASGKTIQSIDFPTQG